MSRDAARFHEVGRESCEYCRGAAHEEGVCPDYEAFRADREALARFDFEEDKLMEERGLAR